MNGFVLRVALLLLGSGFCALVYQTAWLRMLRVVFGGTTAANAAVLAVFMGGLGFGAWLLGEKVEKRDDPLRFYAMLEVGIALSAAASPLLVALARSAYIGLGGVGTLGYFGGTVLLLALTALVLGVPAFLMGGTLPAVARAVETSADPIRRHASLLYGLNTLGSVTAVVFTTFWSIEVLGTRTTLWTGSALNLVVAGLAWWMASGAATEASTEAAEAPPPASPLPAGAPLEWIAVPRPLVLTAAAVVGFAFFLMELVWYRMLAPILGGSTYTFGVILAVALLGIGLGGLLYARGRSDVRPSILLFALTCSLEALLIGIPYALGDWLALLASAVVTLGHVSFTVQALGWAALTAIVVLPAAIVSGYQFPVLLALAGVGARDVGRDVGHVYASNTVGAIVGSLAGGFGLLPLLTATGAWRFAVFVLVLLSLGCLIWAASRGAQTRQALPAIALAALALATGQALGPTGYWRHSGIGVGHVDMEIQSTNDYWRMVHRLRRTILWEEDGREAGVALDRDSSLSFVVDGKSDGNARLDAPTMVLAGLFGAIRHPAPKRVLVVGLGTGETAGWLAMVPEVERVDVVELEPVVVEVARACRDANLAALENPKVHVIIGDAREVLATATEEYDLIVSEPSNPYRVGVASLFTQDFYRIVDAHLAEDGIFVQWVQAYSVDARTIRTAYATLHSVFPSIESWEGISNGDLLFVTSRERLQHDFTQMHLRSTSTPYLQALQHVSGVYGVKGVYASFIGTPELADAVAAAHDGPLHTDDQPVFEYAVARTASQEPSFELAQIRATAIRHGWSEPEFVGGEEFDWREIDELRTLAALAHEQPPALFLPNDMAAEYRVQARRAWGKGEFERAGMLWAEQEEQAMGPMDLTMLSELYATTGTDEALAYIELLERQNPTEAAAVRARWYYETGQPAEAARSLAEALVSYRRDPWAHRHVMERAIRFSAVLAEAFPEHCDALVDALSRPFSVYMSDELRRYAYTRVATLVDFDRYCVDAFTALEPWPAWEEEFLEPRARCYREASHPLATKAARDLDRYRAGAGVDFDAGM